MEELQLPAGFARLENQVAGHVFQFEANTLGLLQQANTGCVLKPFGKRVCGEREHDFYQQVSRNDAHGSPLARARPFVPRFHEKVQLCVNRKEHVFLKLEDLTYGMRRPCIMDVKVGARTWDPDATPEKRAVEQLKYANCKHILGLCLPGFQVYSTDASGATQLARHGKEYGKQLDAAGFRVTLAEFLHADQKLCAPLIRELLRQLYEIRSWFTVQTSYHFYASSLLIAYDYDVLQQWRASGTPLNGQLKNGFAYKGDADHSTRPLDPGQWVKVRMIDFAHVFPAADGRLDENYLFGLQNLIAIVEQLLDR